MLHSQRQACCKPNNQKSAIQYFAPDAVDSAANKQQVRVKNKAEIPDSLSLAQQKFFKHISMQDSVVPFVCRGHSVTTLNKGAQCPQRTNPQQQPRRPKKRRAISRPLCPHSPIHAISARDPARLAFILVNNSSESHPSRRAKIKKKISTTTHSPFLNIASMRSDRLIFSVQDE